MFNVFIFFVDILIEKCLFQYAAYVNSADSFCYVCGEFTVKAHVKRITSLIKKAYELYFGCRIGDQDKVWAPHIVCAKCTVNLRGWIKGTVK